MNLKQSTKTDIGFSREEILGALKETYPDLMVLHTIPKDAKMTIASGLVVFSWSADRALPKQDAKVIEPEVWR